MAARQNARLFGYYVSAYGRESGNQIGGVSNDPLAHPGMKEEYMGGEGDVNIFILLYPCNSRDCKSAPVINVESSRRFSRESLYL